MRRSLRGEGAAPDRGGLLLYGATLWVEGAVFSDPFRFFGFFTATTSIYAIGAGITAAGTGLAFQLILTKGFKFYSFQLQDMDALYFGEG